MKANSPLRCARIEKVSDAIAEKEHAETISYYESVIRDGEICRDVERDLKTRIARLYEDGPDYGTSYRELTAKLARRKPLAER